MKHLMVRPFAVLIVCLLLAACGGNNEANEASGTPLPTPTIHSLFIDPSPENGDEAAGAASPAATAVASAETEPQPAETVVPVVRPTIATRVVSVFGNRVESGWTFENSIDMTVDPRRRDTSSRSNGYLLAFTPQADFGKLMFTVTDDSEEVYLRDDVLAVRFWLYSGDGFIGTEDLGVTVIGSNAFPYWVADDDSVEADDSLPLFIPTRLYFLNIEDDIPADTWIQVEMWLNELLFEPNYEYVTGIIIENDEGFLREIYLDDLELVLKE